MKERIAIVDGLRTPFAKAGGPLARMSADDLGTVAVRELMARCPVDPNDLDELIMGNVAQPGDAANIARVIALKAGLRQDMPAYTVHRNCASGMEAITTAANKILAGEADVICCGGTESMSNLPLMYNRRAVGWFMRLAKARTVGAKVGAFAGTPVGALMDPIIGVKIGLTDPVCGLNMGQTAEVLAREFTVTREEQDAFALQSHQRACAAQESGALGDEIIPIPVGPDYKTVMEADDGPRPQQSMQALAKLKPVFDRVAGTVTAGNACPLTDGAVAMLVMTESTAKERGLEPLGYLSAYSYAALDGSRMGLGPVYATAKLLAKTHTDLASYDRIELNEAFAAQILACGRAFESEAFARKYLDRTNAIGSFDYDKVNVNGGAIALGHPVGATGAQQHLDFSTQASRKYGNS